MEVLELFREQAALWSRLIDPKRPPSEWGDAAHTLKGAALGIGAERLAEACSEAEDMARRADPPTGVAAALITGNVKDRLADTLETVARVVYELSVSGDFRRSYDPNS